MYFGKKICGFLIYSQHHALGINLSCIWNHSWLLSVWVEIRLYEKDRCDIMHGRVCFLPRRRVSSPMTSVFKSLLTESRERDRAEVTQAKKFLWDSELDTNMQHMPPKS